MVNVNVNLSDDLQEFVVAQVSSGQFKGPSDYIESLVTRAKRNKEFLETLLIEGLESGEPIALDDMEWRRIRDDLSRRVGQ